MKTLSKLTINPSRFLKPEELKNLKGGWDGYCWVYDGQSVVAQGPASGPSEDYVYQTCSEMWDPYRCECQGS